MAKTPTEILLALQGGGSHCALAWGVLDRLLEEPQLRVQAISGTSAGAMNGLMLAQGLAEGGSEQATAVLKSFWSEVARSALFSPFKRTLRERATDGWSLDYNPAYIWFDLIARIWSPYESNPLDHNPLREILTDQLDIELLNSERAPRLYVTATHVRTGQPRVFTQPDITIDTVLASAAIPTLFRAVEIDGEAYWDGGYTGNPALFPLVRDNPGKDLILIQSNPFERDGIPKTAREIANRMNEITFNAALLKELRIALHAREQFSGGSSTRLHRVLCDDTLNAYAPSSKLNVEAAYLRHLFQNGRSRAQAFLSEFGAFLGVKESFDPRTLFMDRPIQALTLEAAE